LAPIEALWISLIAIFGLIGIVRGFLRELGVTTTVLMAIYIIYEFLEGHAFTETLLGRASEMVPTFGAFVAEDPKRSLVKFIIYLLFMAFVVFISYHGETLAFGGRPPKGLAGPLLGLLVGLLNGYLIVGTIWYYLDDFGYPIGWLEPERLTTFAKAALPYLPVKLLDFVPANLKGPALVACIAFLILLRVIR